jgi:hypothetical protein
VIEQTEHTEEDPDACDACFEREAVLEYVREEAGRIDRPRSRLYHSVSSRRIENAAWLAYNFMAVHRELHLRVGRGARSGKRAHAAEVRRLLESTNDADLALAMAVLVAAIGTLPPDGPRRDD